MELPNRAFIPLVRLRELQRLISTFRKPLANWYLQQARCRESSGWSKWCERSRLASLLFFPYAFPVKRPPRYLRYFMAECFPRAFFLLLHVVALACGGSALQARPQQPAKEAAPAVTKVEPPTWWVGLTPEVM